MTNLSRRVIPGTVLALSLLILPVCGQRKAPQTAQGARAVDKSSLEAYVRHLNLWPAEVKVEIGDPRPSTVPGLLEIVVTASAGNASLQQTLLLSGDGNHIIRGTVHDLRQNPFHAEASKLTTDGQPSLGAPGAPVTVVLFTDFQCPYCRAQAEVIRANLVTAYPKQVRFYFKDFPLEQIHPWARQAAIAGRCVFQQSPQVFWLYHDWVFGQQAQINVENLNAKVLEFARDKQIDSLQLNRCLQTKATDADVSRSIAEAHSLQIDSTPTMFINGRRISQHLPWPQLKALIDNELAYLGARSSKGARP